jgi:hypothetical protein
MHWSDQLGMMFALAMALSGFLAIVGGREMIRALVIAALVAGGVAAPATAATFDAFSSFTGTQGAGGFTYGSFSSTLSTFTAFTGPTGCVGLISNTICLGSLPGAFKTTAGAGTSGSVIVPANALILHPGNGDDAAYVEFTASTAGSYSLLSSFTVQDTNPSGVDISFFLRVGGVLQFVAPVGSLSGGNPLINYSNSGSLGIGDSVGIIIDKQGVFFNDSTGVNLSLTRVPEPLSWVMMIAGFGLVGLAARRRRTAVAA